MPWIDITRNLDTGNREKVVDLFTFNKLLYAIVKVYDAIPVDTNLVHAFDPGMYKVYEHLGADPPVVDIIWGQPRSFPNFSIERGYVPAGKAEDAVNGFIYLGNADAGEVYVNATAGVIDGTWNVLSGPFGLLEFTGREAVLRDLLFYNNKLYVAHFGGVSSFNKVTKEWDLVGVFEASPNSFGQTVSLFGHLGEIYAAVAYGDVGKVHKYNESVRSPQEWILVGELPSESLVPSKFAEYNNSVFLIANDVDKNVFDLSQIDTTLTGQPRFFAGVNLAGVPTSILKYRKDGLLWATCVREEFTRRGYLKGDVNADGKVDWTDAFDLADYLFGGGSADFVSSAAADVNFTGTLGISDLTQLVTYLSGQVVELPGDSPVLIDTVGPNLITDLLLNRSSLVTAGVPTDVSTTIINLQRSSEFSDGPRVRRFDFEVNSNNQSIIWAQQKGPKSVNQSDMNTPAYLDPVNTDSMLLVGPITTRENGIFSIRGDAIVASHGGFTDYSNNILTTVLRLDVGIAAVLKGAAPKFVTGILDSPYPTPPWPFWLPWLNNPDSWPGAAAAAPIELSLLNRWFSHSFNPSKFDEIAANWGYIYPDQIEDFYFKIHVYIANTAIGNGQPRIGWESGIDVIIYDAPIPPPTWRHYRPAFRIENLTGQRPGVLPDVAYIVKTRADIPPEFDTDLHTIVTPSGPDQWFVRFERIVDGVGKVIYPDSIPENFDGIVLSRLVTGGVNLKPGESYELNVVVNPPLVNRDRNEVKLTIRTPVTSLGFPLIFNQTILPVVGGANRFYPIKHTFTVPTAAFSPGDLTNVPISIEWEERHIFTVAGTLTSYEAIISDVNLVQKITGATANAIYQYNGQSWTNTRTGMVDPNSDVDIPRTGLVDNFDIRSNNYQLYSYGGGRVWVWHYDGGLYSGSAAGVRFDRRPQIVNIV